MEAIIVSGFAFFAGLIVRSLFVPSRPPQVVYVQTEPQEREGSGGCLVFILVGAVVLALLASSGI